MGDNGKLFLPEALVPVYRDTIVPLAVTLTPNAFEAEQLTGLRIEDEGGALAACAALHDRGPSTVVSPADMWLLDVMAWRARRCTSWGPLQWCTTLCADAQHSQAMGQQRNAVLQPLRGNRNNAAAAHRAS